MARFATFTVGAQVIVLPKGLQVRPSRRCPRTTTSTRSSTPSSRSCASPRRSCAPTRTFLRRVLRRRRRRAADGRGVPQLHGQHGAEQARAAGRRTARPQGVRRAVGAEVGRAAADPLVATRSATRRCSSITTGCRTRSPATCRSTSGCRSCSRPTAARSRTRRPITTRTRPTSLKVSENVAQVFMGMRIQCAQCHNHPFDRWTMNDYYGFAAFFAPDRPQGRRRPARDRSSSTRGGGEVTHPVGGRVMKPKFLGGGDARRRRARTAARCWPQWLASPENPYFATNLANIVWAHFFGHGHHRRGRRRPRQQSGVEPRAARRAGQAVHRLQVRLQEAGRATSARRGPISWRRKPTPATRATRATSPAASIRRIRAETLLDCISAGDRDEEQVPRPAARAPGRCRSPTAAISTYFLTTFGRATRETVCSCEVKLEPTLSQSLHLLNGDTTTQQDRSRATSIGRRCSRRRCRRTRSSRSCTSAA